MYITRHRPRSSTAWCTVAAEQSVDQSFNRSTTHAIVDVCRLPSLPPRTKTSSQLLLVSGARLFKGQHDYCDVAENLSVYQYSVLRQHRLHKARTQPCRLIYKHAVYMRVYVRALVLKHIHSFIPPKYSVTHSSHSHSFSHALSHLFRYSLTQSLTQSFFHYSLASLFIHHRHSPIQSVSQYRPIHSTSSLPTHSIIHSSTHPLIQSVSQAVSHSVTYRTHMYSHARTINRDKHSFTQACTHHLLCYAVVVTQYNVSCYSTNTSNTTAMWSSN